MESGKADIAYMKNTPHVPLRQSAEEKIRGKGAQSGVARLERMRLNFFFQEVADMQHRDSIRLVLDFTSDLLEMRENPLLVENPFGKPLE